MPKKAASKRAGSSRNPPCSGMVRYRPSAGGGTAMSAALRPTSSLVVVGARTTEQCTKAMGGGPANGRPSVLTVAKILHKLNLIYLIPYQ